VGSEAACSMLSGRGCRLYLTRRLVSVLLLSAGGQQGTGTPEALETRRSTK
jgi:hypothetical protein